MQIIEKAPEDRFVIASTKACPFGEGSVAINLAPAMGGSIFDVTASGASGRGVSAD